MSEFEKNKKAKKVLPSNRWLIRNGYKGLIDCMRKYPDKFKHIKQNKNIKNKENLK